ncbi:MAG TPA: hypothetical protein VNW04_00380 [Puia sp.]|jgi:hypothetical protein|nr:hypothetical protein [Puia sp.]
MKKIDLLHLSILVIALLSGYSALEYLIEELDMIPLMVGPVDTFSYRASFFLVMALGHAVICIVFIVNGRKYAARILKDEMPQGSWEDVSRWDLDRRSTLFVLFVGIGLYICIQSGASIGTDCFELFSAKVDYMASGRLARHNYLPNDLLRFTLGAGLVYAAPNLTNFIEKKIAVRLDSEGQST